MEAYSLDLRQRIVQACDERIETRQEVADRFGVSTAFIRRLLQRRRQTDSIAAKPHRGGFAPILQGERLERVRSLVLDQPDATLAELCGRLHQCEGVKVSLATMCEALKRLGLVRKKRLYMRASGIRRVFNRCDRVGVRRFDPSRQISWYLSTKAAQPRR